jgi:hypothetical protein
VTRHIDALTRGAHRPWEISRSRTVCQQAHAGAAETSRTDLRRQFPRRPSETIGLVPLSPYGPSGGHLLNAIQVPDKSYQGRVQ